MIQELDDLKLYVDTFLEAYDSLIKLEKNLYRQLSINEQVAKFFEVYNNGLFKRIIEEQSIMQNAYDEIIYYFKGNIIDKPDYDNELLMVDFSNALSVKYADNTVDSGSNDFLDDFINSYETESNQRIIILKEDDFIRKGLYDELLFNKLLLRRDPLNPFLNNGKLILPAKINSPLDVNVKVLIHYLSILLNNS